MRYNNNNPAEQKRTTSAAPLTAEFANIIRPFSELCEMLERHTTTKEGGVIQNRQEWAIYLLSEHAGWSEPAFNPTPKCTIESNDAELLAACRELHKLTQTSIARLAFASVSLNDSTHEKNACAELNPFGFSHSASVIGEHALPVDADRTKTQEACEPLYSCCRRPTLFGSSDEKDSALSNPAYQAMQREITKPSTGH